MWYPGNQRYYNEFLSPRVTFALGRQLSSVVLVERHPGLFQSSYYDQFTKSLDVRPRLQNFAAPGVVKAENRNVVALMNGR